MSLTPFVNSSMIVGQISKSVNQKSDTEEMHQNDGSRNKYYEAQKRSDMYMKLKDRQPMVFEYLQTGKPEKWVSITMYINPDKLSVAQQKVKGKQFTRGGIFYHHWGEDHPVMSLSGTTGLSGMKGIQVLENIYHASGTLLRYQNFGPSTYASNNLTTQDDMVFVSDDLNSTVAIMNKAANSRSETFVKRLKDVVSNTKDKDVKWKEYVSNQDMIEQALAGNKMMQTLRARNEELRKTFWFPDGSGKDGGHDGNKSDEITTMVRDYTNLWTEYIGFKVRATELEQLMASQQDQMRLGELRREWQELHDSCVSIRRQYKFEPDIETGTYSIEDLNKMKGNWIRFAQEYVQNKIHYATNAAKTEVQGQSVNVEQLMQKNKELARENGFPDGNSTQLKEYAFRGKLKSGENGNYKIQDLRKITVEALNAYQGILRAKGIFQQTLKVREDLYKWVQDQIKLGIIPAAESYKDEAISRYSKISGLDNSIYTALAFQDTIYYTSSSNDAFTITSDFISSSTTSSLSTNDTPIIPLKDDNVGKIAAITEDRAQALNDLMVQMAAYEEKEKKFADELKANALSDIMDDLTDEWRPRRVLIYYENRVYVAHFDQFSYSRDASNPLLIRYEMRLTIEKQIIGSSK